MSEAVDILAIAAELRHRAHDDVYCGMTMNHSLAASVFLARAMASERVADADYAAAERLMMDLRA